MLQMPKTPNSLRLASLSLSNYKSRSRIVDVKKPSGIIIRLDVELLVVKLHDGEVDQSFKFGGLPKFDAKKQKEMRKEKKKEKEERANVMQYHTPA